MESNHPARGFSYSECFRYHLTPARLSVPPRLVGPSYQWVNEYGRPPTAVHEAMWRQMEKDRIREQIIAQEIARRHILEAEVRRELIVERAIGSICTSRLNRINVNPKAFPPLALPQKIDGIRLGESSGMSTLVRHQFGSLQTSSLMGANTWTSQFMPPSDTPKAKQKVILQAKPEAKVSGMKRKAEVLPSVSVSELMSSADNALKKKVKEEWACALCEVSATSEQALMEHRQGKRHKAKEAGLKKNGKNFSIGLFPKKNLMPNKLLEIPSLPSLQKGVIPIQANSENTETNNYQDISRSPQLDKNVKKKKKAPDGRTGSRKRRNFKFWCEMCQVGAFSETVMETHKKGKKHQGHLLEQNTVGTPSAQITLQKMYLTEEAGEVVEGNASRDSAPIIDKVKLDCYQNEAGEDEDNIESKGLGVVADGVELEGNQNEAEKDVEDTTSGSLDPVTVVVKLEGEKKEGFQDDVEDTNPKVQIW